jgi:hypothetical protein
MLWIICTILNMIESVFISHVLGATPLLMALPLFLFILQSTTKLLVSEEGGTYSIDSLPRVAPPAWLLAPGCCQSKKKYLDSSIAKSSGSNSWHALIA